MANYAKCSYEVSEDGTKIKKKGLVVLKKKPAVSEPAITTEK